MRRFLLVPLLLLSSACSAETVIELNVGSDGAGEVAVRIVLDAEAADRYPDLGEQLATDDLEARGWQVSGPVTADESTEYRISQTFDTPEQADALIDQIDADGGPIRDFRLVQDRSFPRVETTMSGNIDLSAGITAWGDPVLQQRVGSALGFDPVELSQNLGVDAAATLPVSFEVDLPGSEDASPSRADGRWQLAYGESNALSASSSAFDTRPIGYFAAALMMAVGAIVIFVVWKPYRPRHAR